MIFSAISIFPEMFTSLTSYGITGRAFINDICHLNLINPRDFAFDSYKRIDDKSFGGGPGMVMKIEPLELSLQAAIDEQQKIGIQSPLRVYLSPQGQIVDQVLINSLTLQSGIIFVCGRYEGVDERFIQHNIDLEISTGDFVVSGGELPAMLVMDAIIRQLPGVLQDKESAVADSFMNGLLDYPHYTHPREYNGEIVPEVLLSGNHKQIERWRLQMSLWRTYTRRPDLFKKRTLTKLESGLLDELLRSSKPD
ncbi:MAG: tRNA (guanosine(37)-N1)-methyltransferase TrmD [Burkholderiales bacterium]|nr:tRNA (guanosine(37)-N1)-methyltransferase TrmD [Burkholderiales bacterium]